MESAEGKIRIGDKHLRYFFCADGRIIFPESVTAFGEYTVYSQRGAEETFRPVNMDVYLPAVFSELAAQGYLTTIQPDRCVPMRDLRLTIPAGHELNIIASRVHRGNVSEMFC